VAEGSSRRGATRRAPERTIVSSGSTRARVLFWLKICLSVGLLSYLFTLIDLERLLDHLRKVDLRYLLVAFLLLLAQIGISSFKWQLILRSDGVRMRLPFLIKTYMIGNFLSLFLPTSFGGDIYRVLAVRGINRDLAKSTSSVLFDRLSGVMALVSIGIFAYLALPDQPYEPVVITGYVLGLAAFLLVSSDRAIEIIDGSKVALVKKIGKLLLSFRNYRRNPRSLALIVLLSFAFQLNIVLVNKVYTMALGLDIPLSMLLVIIPWIYLTEILPISINGLGVRESAFGFFFVLIGHTVEDGLAVALLVIGMRYLLGLIGGTLLLVTLITSRASRPGLAGRAQPEPREP
jgi:glycosyltransferase 2 family protein